MRTLILLVLFLLTGCSSKNITIDVVPLPKLNDREKITLRVVYAENPRFHLLEEKEIRRLLSFTQAACKEHLGVDVTFDLLPPVTIASLFNTLKPEIKKERAKEIYDFRRGGDIKRLTDAFKEGFVQGSSSLEEMIAYATPYLDTKPAETSVEGFARMLSDTLISRIRLWQQIQAVDGKSVIDDTPYNEWVYWDSLGYSELPFDIVITNTLIASIEYYGQDIHSALRGGVTVGTTTNAKNSPFGAFIFWSTFPFTEKGKLLHTLRGNEDYSLDTAMELSGTYLAHEIGHLLFHYGHPFETASCIMSPVPMLHFREWKDNLDAKGCRDGNFPAMQKGAAKIYFEPSWY